MVLPQLMHKYWSRRSSEFKQLLFIFSCAHGIEGSILFFLAYAVLLYPRFARKMVTEEAKYELQWIAGGPQNYRSDPAANKFSFHFFFFFQFYKWTKGTTHGNLLTFCKPLPVDNLSKASRHAIGFYFQILASLLRTHVPMSQPATKETT